VNQPPPDCSATAAMCSLGGAGRCDARHILIGVRFAIWVWPACACRSACDLMLSTRFNKLIISIMIIQDSDGEPDDKEIG
jgi:hypothetical protein